MSNLTILGDTSGSVVLQAPAVSGSTTLTLPAKSGTVLTTQTTGTVIQTVFASTTTSNSVNSTSYVASNLVGTITPQYSNSKILIMYGIGMTATNTTNSFNIKNQIYRSISGGAAGFITATDSTMFSLDARNAGTIYGQQYFQCCMNYLDSPATTNAVSYTVYGKITSQTGSAVAGDFLGFNGIGTMVLQEIAQ